MTENTRHEAPDVVELRRLAEAATPGPWSLTDGDPAMNGQHWTIRRQGVPGIRVSGFTYGFNGDAAYNGDWSVSYLRDGAEVLRVFDSLGIKVQPNVEPGTTPTTEETTHE